MMAVNLCAAHKKTDSWVTHEVLLTCFLQSCSTRRWISYRTRNISHMLYTKVNSRVTCEFRLSHSTKIEEHTSVHTLECQLRRELYRNFNFILTMSVNNNTSLILSRHFAECGVTDPSWMEIRHFVYFLNAQLEDCENSLFCNSQHTRDVLPGFKKFVIKFMLKMSKVQCIYIFSSANLILKIMVQIS